MSITYKFSDYTEHLSDKEQPAKGCRPSFVTQGTIHTRDLALEIVRNNYYSSPDAIKAIEAVFVTIEALLKKGYIVSLDGFGSFQPTLQFGKDRIPSTERRAESIEVKSIVFKATTEMKKRITAAGIERALKRSAKK